MVWYGMVWYGLCTGTTRFVHFINLLDVTVWNWLSVTGACIVDICSDSERLVSGSLRHRDITPRTANTASVISTGAHKSVRSASESSRHLQSWPCRRRSNHWLPGIQLPAVCLLGVAVSASSVHCLVSTYTASSCDQSTAVCDHCTVSDVVNR